MIKFCNDNFNNISYEEYQAVEGITYHILIEEKLINDDPKNPKTSQFQRVYLCYGEENNRYPLTYVVAIERVENIETARNYIMSNYQDEFELQENTILSDEVVRQWKDENYIPLNEYREKSRSGLKYEDLK